MKTVSLKNTKILYSVLLLAALCGWFTAELWVSAACLLFAFALNPFGKLPMNEWNNSQKVLVGIHMALCIGLIIACLLQFNSI